jgi:ASC-1-like (ASCH) protein
MATHTLKINSEFLSALLDGSKTFEVRKNDRNYQAGDTIEFEGAPGKSWQITYVLPLNCVPGMCDSCPMGQDECGRWAADYDDDCILRQFVALGLRADNA